MNRNGTFAVRGFHLDLRIQVMRPAALRRLAEEVAAAGLNTLIVEWEAAFPYRRNATLSHGLAYSPLEVGAFVRYCRSLGLEVIPLQQSLGHLEYVLRHPRYMVAREDTRDLCQLCPRKPTEARRLLRGLLEDVRELHDGPFIHLGGDEAYLLGHCPACRAYAHTHGLSQLYAAHMRNVIAEARALGWRPVIWADMLLKHPECAGLIPTDTVLVDWNYGWARDRFGDPQKLLDRGFEIWGAAALRSAPDNHSLTWWDRHLRNFRDFIPQAARDSYRGMLLTSWSTSGIYGYERDGSAGEEVTALRPVRRVYPLNGHSLLLSAFKLSLAQPGSFEPRNFLLEYAAGRFGLAAADRRAFAAALLAQAPDGRSPTRDLASIHPRRHHAEFAHLRLIEDFHRLNRETMHIAAHFNGKNYTRPSAWTLLRRVEPLVRRSRTLEVRYSRLQRNYLPAAEIAEDSAYRRKSLLNLHAALRNQVR